ncbi:transposable element Tcb2 transposase [Trichonephila clavipes]|nr:transposable element Tcb2 transposase [Trichonephila clavipes]
MQRLPGAIFQHHNARPHTARVSQDCLYTVTTFLWHARSPDLSPMKHIWDHMGRRVGHPTSLNELVARHGGTLNNRRASSPLVRLVELEERWGAPDYPQNVLLSNWGRTEPNRNVTCIGLKAKANDRPI